MAHTGPVAKLKYFDENNSWTDRKPSAIATPNIKHPIVCNVDFYRTELSEIDRFNELLAANLPTVAILHNVTPAALVRLKNGLTARKMYSLLETSRAEMHEESTVALLRLGLQCEPLEAPVKPEGKALLRALIQVVVRISGGPTITITVLNMEHSVTQPRRLTVAGAVLKTASSTDVSMLISNITEGIQHTDDVYREIQNTRNSHGYVDAMEEGLEKSMTSPWVLWMRSAKYSPAGAAAELLNGNEPRYMACSIVPRGTAAAVGAPGSIAIPMPRSAKTGRTKSPGPPTGAAATPTGVSSNSQLLTDPAILSAEAVKGGGNSPAPSSVSGSGYQSQPSPSSQGKDIIMRLARHQQQQQQHKWQLIHSFNLKVSDAKLSNLEAIFDVSNLFPAPGDAVDALNSGALKWPADYCVVHSTVLCSLDIPHLDRQSFRRYARDAKGNATLSAQIFAARNAYTSAHNSAVANGGGAGAASGSPAGTTAGAASSAVAATVTLEKPNAWSKPMRAEAEEFSAFARQLKRDDMPARREWSEACCTIVYQLTPREFKFNVTQAVGLGKDNLKKAVYLLNRAKNGVKDANNPLQDYPYDYALLFCVERQGYWLIAATHVPCDIVSCRMVV